MPLNCTIKNSLNGKKKKKKDGLVGSPCSPRDSQKSSPAPQLEGINSLVLCLLYSSALTTALDHWEDCSLDYMDLCQQSNVSAF